MKGLLLQYDDRSPRWAQKLIDRNKRAASQINFDHIYLNESEFDAAIPPYWRKVFLVEKYFKTNIYSCIVWIDSDAVLVNESEFLECITSEFSVAFSSKPCLLRREWWPLRTWAAPFCAGVFIVKNTAVSLEILEEWKSGFNPLLWKQDPITKKWSGVGVYGGPSYEQGCFELLIFRSPKFRKHLLQMVHWRLNYLPIHGETCNSKTIFLHYWNGNRSRILRDWGGNAEDFVNAL